MHLFPLLLEPTLESSSAPDDSAVVAEFERPEDDPEPPFEPLRGPWFPMFGDHPHYEPAV